jgi:hypothetical protein
MYQPFFYQNEALGIRPQAPTAMQALVLCKGASKISWSLDAHPTMAIHFTLLPGQMTFTNNLCMISPHLKSQIRQR